MIGTGELAAMKPSAWIVNVGRGELIDQDALIEACTRRRIAGAFLDTVTPEPLPPGHPPGPPNVIHSMHLSGRSQTWMFLRAAALFVEISRPSRTGAAVAERSRSFRWLLETRVPARIPRPCAIS